MSYTVWARNGYGHESIVVTGVSKYAAASIRANVHELLNSWGGPGSRIAADIWVEED